MDPQATTPTPAPRTSDSPQLAAKELELAIANSRYTSALKYEDAEEAGRLKNLIRDLESEIEVLRRKVHLQAAERLASPRRSPNRFLSGGLSPGRLARDPSWETPVTDKVLEIPELLEELKEKDSKIATLTQQLQDTVKGEGSDSLRVELNLQNEKNAALEEALRKKSEECELLREKMRASHEGLQGLQKELSVQRSPVRPAVAAADSELALLNEQLKQKADKLAADLAALNALLQKKDEELTAKEQSLLHRTEEVALKDNEIVTLVNELEKWKSHVSNSRSRSSNSSRDSASSQTGVVRSSSRSYTSQTGTVRSSSRSSSISGAVRSSSRSSSTSQTGSVRSSSQTGTVRSSSRSSSTSQTGNVRSSSQTGAVRSSSKPPSTLRASAARSDSRSASRRVPSFTLATLTAATTKTQSASTTKSDVSAQLAHAMASHLEEVEILNQQLRVRDSDIEALTKQLRSREEEVQRLKEELLQSEEEAVGQLEGLTEGLRKANDETGVLKQQLEEERSAKRALDEKLIQLKEDNAELQEKVTKVEIIASAQVQVLTKQLESIKEQVQGKEAELQGLRDQVVDRAERSVLSRQVQEELREKEAELQLKSDENHALRVEMATKDEELEVLYRQIQAEQDAATATFAKPSKDATSRTITSEQPIRTARHVVGESEPSSEVAELRRQLDEWQRLKELEDELEEEDQHELALLREELKAALNEIEQLQEEVRTSGQELEKCKMELKNAHFDRDLLEAQLSGMTNAGVQNSDDKEMASIVSQEMKDLLVQSFHSAAGSSAKSSLQSSLPVPGASVSVEPSELQDQLYQAQVSAQNLERQLRSAENRAFCELEQAKKLQASHQEHVERLKSRIRELEESNCYLVDELETLQSSDYVYSGKRKPDKDRTLVLNEGSKSKGKRVLKKLISRKNIVKVNHVKVVDDESHVLQGDVNKSRTGQGICVTFNDPSLNPPWEEDLMESELPRQEVGSARKTYRPYGFMSPRTSPQREAGVPTSDPPFPSNQSIDTSDQLVRGVSLTGSMALSSSSSSRTRTPPESPVVKDIGDLQSHFSNLSAQSGGQCSPPFARQCNPSAQSPSVREALSELSEAPTFAKSDTPSLAKSDTPSLTKSHTPSLAKSEAKSEAPSLAKSEIPPLAEQDEGSTLIYASLASTASGKSSDKHRWRESLKDRVSSKMFNRSSKPLWGE